VRTFFVNADTNRVIALDHQSMVGSGQVEIELLTI
jgi:hypothetical protein